jgi:MEDS: MEthanogen/methylotroph, DcmR Sensory domain
MKRTTVPIFLAGSQIGEVRHVCAFFNSGGEEHRVLLPFIKDGFECGDKAVHVVNPDQRRDHLQRLAAVGIDPAAARATRGSHQHRSLYSGRPFRSGSNAGSVRADG